MKDFSLIYGRYRQLPLIFVVAVAAAALVYLDRSANDDGADCVAGPPGLEAVTCDDQPVRAVSGDDLPVPLTGAGCSQGGCPPARITGGEPGLDPNAGVVPTTADWSGAPEPGAVPFIPLEPSPNPMTPAGRAMVAEAEAEAETADAGGESESGG